MGDSLYTKRGRESGGSLSCYNFPSILRAYYYANSHTMPTSLAVPVKNIKKNENGVCPVENWQPRVAAVCVLSRVMLVCEEPYSANDVPMIFKIYATDPGY